MVELTDQDLEAIHSTHDKVIQITTVLLGTNGDNGLVGDVKRNGEAIVNLGEKHHTLSRNFWILVGGLAGSGVLGGSLWGLLR